MTGIVLLDGGTGQELVARSTLPPMPLWSAEIMERAPELVRDVQRDFLLSGARCLTLNSYTATPERIGREMESAAAERRFEALQRQAIQIARDAQAAAKAAGALHDTAIAGCLPPLGGSYHASRQPDPALTRATYDRIVAIQGEASDVILAETMAATFEARAATQAVVAAGHRPWIAFTVQEDDGLRLRSGETLAQGVDAVLADGAEAILLNCSRPEAITAGLAVLSDRGVPFGAYANGFVDAAQLAIGSTVAGMDVREDLGPDAYADHVMQWVEAGATIVGGCCEIGPGHIARLRDRIEAAGHDLTTPLRAAAVG